MRTWKSERGMSLVEATIILMVLAILTSVLAPSIGDYVNDARQVKAKEDLEVLGLSVARLVRDTGLPFPVRAAGAAPSKASTNRVDLLVTEGQLPTITAGTGVPAAAAGYLIQNAVDWNDPIGAEVELATDHLITNANGYTVVTFPAPAGPVPGLGWRGPRRDRLPLGIGLSAVAHSGVGGRGPCSGLRHLAGAVRSPIARLLATGITLCRRTMDPRQFLARLLTLQEPPALLLMTAFGVVIPGSPLRASEEVAVEITASSDDYAGPPLVRVYLDGALIGEAVVRAVRAHMGGRRPSDSPPASPRN